MTVDDRERAKQALTRFAIEALDALAQPLDRFDQVVALAGQRGVLALDLAQFLLGAQVDRSQALALAPQSLKRGVAGGDLGQRGARRDAGPRRQGPRRAFRPLLSPPPP